MNTAYFIYVEMIYLILGMDMNSATFKLLENLLKDRRFGVCVDLGCGEGYYGSLLKEHCNYLIGIDHNLGRLSVAKKFSGYDQVLYTDIRKYTPPSETEAFIMLEIIEHLPKTDGKILLQKLSWMPFTVISTPATFHARAKNGHQSLWTEQDLQAFGFQTQIFNYGLLSYPFKEGIFAVRCT